jgi:tripartite-type tricarboxylate transporter receptor subunit TctC
MTGITRRQALATLSASSLLLSQAASAQEFTRPVRLVVCFAPGGGSDSLARQITGPLGDALKQPVIVDNRPGGNFSIALSYVASQPADGHTLLLTDPAQLVLNPAVYKKVPYDPSGFEPVGMLHRFPFMLVINPNDPAKTLKEWVANAKARPAGINYGSAGAGTPVHLGMEMVNSATGIKGVHVPYKGVGPALNDLIGGQVEAVFVDVGSGLQYVKAGRLKALAVSSPTRHAVLPDVPSFTEAGFPSLQMDAWFGIVVKRGTPPALVQKLNAAVLSAVADPRVSEWIRSIAAVPAPLPNSPQDFARVMQQDSQMWTKVARDFNISLE